MEEQARVSSFLPADLSRSDSGCDSSPHPIDREAALAWDFLAPVLLHSDVEDTRSTLPSTHAWGDIVLNETQQPTPVARGTVETELMGGGCWTFTMDSPPTPPAEVPGSAPNTLILKSSSQGTFSWNPRQGTTPEPPQRFCMRATLAFVAERRAVYVPELQVGVCLPARETSGGVCANSSFHNESLEGWSQLHTLLRPGSDAHSRYSAWVRIGSSRSFLEPEAGRQFSPSQQRQNVKTSAPW
nr:uncharacterized protein LOC112429270 [Macaca nemestrina]